MEKKKLENLLLVSGLTALGVKTGFVVKSKITENSSDGSEENTVGYDNIGNKYNVKVHQNNFVVLHVSNSWTKDVDSLRDKLGKCNEKGISVAIVLDTKADNLSDIYNDIDFLQSIVKEYKIDLPVYCNLDYIMNNKNLNNAQRTEIIEAFLDKTTRSDMYVGLYGTDTNLADCNDRIFNISNYDCFLVQDSENIKYNGVCNIYQDFEGNIKAKLDLSKAIQSNDLNNSSKIVTSGVYTITEGDTYHSLGLRFGLSENDLKKYNDNKKIKIGETIKIPNLYQTIEENKEVSYNYSIARGIDISDYQEYIDWDRVQATSDYVIVEVARNKSNYLKNEGEYLISAIDQISNVTSRNIDLGLYFCITKDMKISVYEERLENYLTRLDNELLANNIKLNKKDVPVFLDFEVYYQPNDYYRLMESFDRICKNHGYEKIGLYGNKTTLTSISQDMKTDANVELKNTDWYVWQSGGPQYSKDESKNYDDVTLEELKEVKNESNSHYTVDIQQVTNVCTDTGARNSVNHCDVSFLYNSELFDNNKEKENNLIESTIEIDLSNYRGVPTNMILAAVEATLTTAVVIGCVKIIGDKLILKIKNKIKERSKKLTK